MTWLWRAQPRATVAVWAHDQARRGLKPIVRRVWSRRGQRSLAVSTYRYEWRCGYGFVHPRPGRTRWLLLPQVNTAAMQLALRDFARAEQLGTRKPMPLS